MLSGQRFEKEPLREAGIGETAGMGPWECSELISKQEADPPQCMKG